MIFNIFLDVTANIIYIYLYIYTILSLLDLL